MRFTKEQMLAVVDGYGTIEVGGKSFEVVDKSDWTQDHKMQFRETIFGHGGKFYLIEEGRSGAPFTDWYYDSEHWDDVVEAIQVEKVEVVTHEWKAVRR